MPIDKKDVKVVTATYKDQPFLIGVGTAKQTEVKGSGQFDATGARGAYESQKELHWDLFYNPNVLPSGFVPIEKAKEIMAGTVAVTSGSADVYKPHTDFKETPSETLKGIENKLQNKRSNANILQLLSDNGLEIHHIIPVSKGGTNKLKNIMVLPKNEHRVVNRLSKRKTRKKKNDS